jgi:hypothetical protein
MAPVPGLTAGFAYRLNKLQSGAPQIQWPPDTESFFHIPVIYSRSLKNSRIPFTLKGTSDKINRVLNLQ